MKKHFHENKSDQRVILRDLYNCVTTQSVAVNTSKAAGQEVTIEATTKSKKSRKAGDGSEFFPENIQEIQKKVTC